ncbi:GNAT family N-acetyltransferase [Sphaerisporangium aureirubrum]|uniref:GNAT family N-acetyltransferase n=1 Tax=Sphaerisporangium aureirubrum TaxID=1544736 RepID=A0ABW1NMR1_9ACTN
MTSSGLRAGWEYPDAWRAAAGMSLLAEESWHRAMAGRLEGRPVWLWLGGDEVTAGLAGIVAADPDAYTFGNLRLLLADTSAPFAPSGADLGGLAPVAGELFPNLFLSCPGYATFPVGSRRDDPAAVGELLGAIVAWASDAGMRAVALPYTETGGVLATCASVAGFEPVPLTSDSYVDVPSGGYPAYLAALPAHRRRRVAAERRRLHALGLHGRLVEHVDAALLDRIVELRVRQRARYGLPADLAAEHARLSLLLTALGDRVSVVTVGDPPLSFTLQVQDGDTWHEVCSGTDYDDPRSSTAYFESVFYTPIETAPTRGVRRVSYGIGAEEGKLLRGCHLIPLECLLLGLTPAATHATSAIAAAWRTTTSEGLNGPDLPARGEATVSAGEVVSAGETVGSASGTGGRAGGSVGIAGGVGGREGL